MGNSNQGRAIMIQGCTSSAGKSDLTAALCRALANSGVRVALFKAQNMSNDAGVTPDGLELGGAQLVLENPAYLERFLAWAGLPAPARLDSLDARLDAIAAQVRANVDWSVIGALL
ncbi:hypothetical protein [Deinococcus sp.]|uniref:nucleotide-binding protein n=1 Tax=Deinococcus sp. TaxID=47478 RepID=UPI002869BA07|nr:hypothetical protein [Deinococcus sp.]